MPSRFQLAIRPRISRRYASMYATADPLAGIDIRLATDADNAQLLALTRATPMAGQIALRLDRDPDFFALIRARGEAIVFVAIYENRVIGCFSAAIFPAFVHGAVETITHAGDLKVHPDFAGRRLALQLVSTMEHHLRDRGIDIGFNLIADGNHRVASIAAGTHGTPLQRPLGSFLVRELLPTPFRARSKTLTVAPATPADLPGVAAMLAGFARTRNFVRPTSLADLELRLVAGTSTILVARNAAGQRLATITLEDTSSLRRNVLLGLPPAMSAALAVLRVLALPLRAVRVPRIGEALKIVYVRFPAVSPDAPAEQSLAALRFLLAEARHTAFTRGFSFLSFGLHERDPLRPALAGMAGFTFTSRAMATSLITPGRIEIIEDQVPYEDFALV